MFSPIPSSSKEVLLAALKQELETVSLVPGGEEKMRKIVGRILKELPGTVEALRDSMTSRVFHSSVIEEILDPSLEKNIVALQKVFDRACSRGEKVNEVVCLELMKKIASKITSEGLLKACTEVLPGVPLHRVKAFLLTVENFYHKKISEGTLQEDALTVAQVKGLMRLVLGSFLSQILEKDEGLRDRIESNPKFKPYLCVIQRDMALDAVYLRVDDQGNPRERYHDKFLRDWITAHHTDPVNRAATNVADIKSDYKGREFIENEIIGEIYPQLQERDFSYNPVGALSRPDFGDGLKRAYGFIQEKCKMFFDDLSDPKVAIAQTEDFTKKVVNFLQEVKRGQIPLVYHSYIDKLIGQEVEKLRSGDSLESVMSGFASKVHDFTAAFPMIERALKDFPAAKEKTLKMVIEAVSRGESARSTFTQYMQAVNLEEEEVKARYPGVMIGLEEWSALGQVEGIPLPKGMLAILNEPWPDNSGRAVGDMCMLVLMPKTVGDNPLTLRSFGDLVKQKCFPDETENTAGYRYVDRQFFRENGDDSIDRSYWALMTRDVLEGSKNRSYAEQKDLIINLGLRGNYEVPKILEAVVCIYMKYIASGVSKERLFSYNPLTYTHCQGGYPGSRRMVVGGFSKEGLHAGFNYTDSCIGIAGVQKL